MNAIYLESYQMIMIYPQNPMWQLPNIHELYV